MSKSLETFFLFTFLIYGADHKNTPPCFLVFFSHISSFVLASFVPALTSVKSFSSPYALRKETSKEFKHTNKKKINPLKPFQFLKHNQKISYDTKAFTTSICHCSKKYFGSVLLSILHPEIKSTLTILTRRLVFPICSSGSLSLFGGEQKKTQNKRLEHT